MSGTVLSRTDRHTQHSSGAARSATVLRRTASAPPASAAPAPAVARPPGGDPGADDTEADPATSALAAAHRPTPEPADLGSLDPDEVTRGWTPVVPSPFALALDEGQAQPAPSAALPVVEPPATPVAEPTAALTVTLAIPLNGDPLTPQTRRLLDALRELVEVGQGAVTTAPAPAPGNGTSDPSAHRGRPPAGAAAQSGSGATVSGPLGGAPTGTVTLTDEPLGASRIAAAGVGPSAEDILQPAVDPAEVRLLTASRQVLLGGEPLAMTRLEFDLLLFLAGNPRRVFTRAQLLGAVWGYEHTGERTVDVHVRRLRVKMGVHVPLITTVYGVGYRLDDDARIVVVAHE